MLRSKIKVGELDTRLVIEQNVISTNAVTNEREESWTTVTTVWAKRLLKGGKEGFEAEQLVATNKETFLMRDSSDLASIDSSWRVFEKGTTDYFYVTMVEQDRRQGFIMIETEGKNG